MSRKPGPALESAKHVAAFEAWYVSDKNFEKARRMLATSDPPLVISKDTIYRWRDLYNWDAKARERDEAVQRERTEQAVKAQVDFLNRKANYGKLLQKRALQFFQAEQFKTDQFGNLVLDTNGKAIPLQHVNNAAVGVQVLQAGVLLEQTAMGLPEWITEVLNADADTLRRVYDTALKELASAANVDADETGQDSAFPAVEIKPVQQDSNSQ